MFMENISYKTDYYKFEYVDGIFYLTYIGGPITLNIAKELVAKRLELTKGKSVLMLVTTMDLKGMEREARSYLSSDAGVEGIKAGAIVTKSPFSTHMANFFMKISFTKSKMPARLFSSEPDAVKWLKQFDD